MPADTRQTTILLPEALLVALEQLALARKVSRNVVIAEAVRLYLEVNNGKS